jgi:diguanylate cyclase (GGDEF)-like protein
MLTPARADEHLHVKRAIFLGLGFCAVLVSYMAAIFGVAPDASVGPAKIASIVLPGIVSAAVLAAYAIWEGRNVHRAQSRADELSAQLVRKEIEIGRLATVDELTGLYTRREFEEMIRLEFERRRRHKRELTLLLLEIDDLAELGEHVGKLGKSYLLSEVAAALRQELRTIDLGCRYTADSLAMLLPETNRTQAFVVAEKLRKRVGRQHFLEEMQQVGVQLTISMGIATVDERMRSHQDLMRAAEQSLYEAKSAGFSQVRAYEPSATPDESERAAS